MNQWPTVFASFRQVDGLNFNSAYDMLTLVISELYKKHLYLLDSDKVDSFDKEIVKQLIQGTASAKDTKGSLMLLTRLMYQQYGKPVILLIDEYDVPVAKESIFTGTNNFILDTITDSRLNEYFGFVQSEVDQILKDADVLDKAESIREWYDGYHFGDFDVYCPWDVMNYLLELQRNPKAKPVSYWKNTSDNAVIRSFIDYAGSNITGKLETLLAGGTIVQRVDENLTYDYLHSSEENLWSTLFDAVWQFSKRSIRSLWTNWKVSVMLLYSRLMIECMQKSTRMITTKFFVIAFRFLRNVVWWRKS